MTPRWLDEPTLETTATVANNRMNRSRRLTGSNGYGRDLGFDVAAFLRAAARPGAPARWLDLCCGEGRALLDAEALLGEAVEITGVDLVDAFWPAPPGSIVRRVATPLRTFEPDPRGYHLVTCVHGLPYVGDKLGVLLRARGWVVEGGRLVAHLDLSHVHLDGKEAPVRVRRLLRDAGFAWNGRAHRVSAEGAGTAAIPVHFRAAAESGPTWTGQPGVLSDYASTPA